MCAQARPVQASAEHLRPCCSELAGQAFIHSMQTVRSSCNPAVVTAQLPCFTRQHDFTELARIFEQTRGAVRRDGTLARLLGENTRLDTNDH